MEITSKADFNKEWLKALYEIRANGSEVSPRGKLTREIPQRTLTVDMRYPVLRVPERKLSYQFMAAEAFWILSGDDRVENIAPFNKHIANFSDNGETFFGAYGPKIRSQLDYVVGKLVADKDTRQAGLTIWRENPPETKDVPCTVAIFFNIRDGKLNAHVFMRSSDVWLGVPYDVFNFSMLAHMICGIMAQLHPEVPTVSPGMLYLTAASSHLYETNWADAEAALVASNGGEVQNPTPTALFREPEILMKTLHDLRTSVPGADLRWWETE
jgi:thymidylate synthase